MENEDKDVSSTVDSNVALQDKTTPSHSLTSNSVEFWRLLSLILLLVVVVFGVSIILLKQKLDYKNDVEIYRRPTLPPASTPTPLPINKIKKNFQPDQDFVERYPYPDEIINLKDENLIAFSCDRTYTLQANGKYTYTEFDEKATKPGSITFDNPAIVDYVTARNNNPPEGVAGLNIQTCLMEDDRTLLVYDSAPNVTVGGGGVGADVNIGFFEGDNTATAKIPMGKGPYFHCSEILAVTKNNVVYAACGGGDGGYGARAIYRVGLLKAYGSDLIYQCESTPDLESGATKSTCTTTN